MVKYFQVYEYGSNLKTILVIYQLEGKSTLWWEETKMVHVLDEKIVTWEDFKTKFKSTYVNERYYDEKSKEFHELRLGQLNIDEFVTKCTNCFIMYLILEKRRLRYNIS